MLQARDLGLETRAVAAFATGLSAIAAVAPLAPLLKKDEDKKPKQPKRELETQELEAMTLGALFVPALSVVGAVAPQLSSKGKRDLSYDPPPRELQALDELFSREPKNWAD